jgi:hypothetical protein
MRLKTMIDNVYRNQKKMEVAVEAKNELSLMDLIRKFEESFKESIKELKRAARDELKSNRRRRGSKKEGGRKDKGETPSQLKPWHDEVRRVWEELKATDAKTPYKRAVAEAHLRRGKPVVAAAADAGKKVSKKAVVAVAPVAKVEEVKAAATPKSEKKSKKSSA